MFFVSSLVSFVDPLTVPSVGSPRTLRKARRKYYFSAADVVIQPYRNATQSGVTPLSYHFEKPMIVTNVGSLPDLVPHEKVGLVCEADPSSIATAIQRYMELGENYFLPHLRSEKQKYSWSTLTKTVFVSALHEYFCFSVRRCGKK